MEEGSRKNSNELLENNYSVTIILSTSQVAPSELVPVYLNAIATEGAINCERSVFPLGTRVQSKLSVSQLGHN